MTDTHPRHEPRIVAHRGHPGPGQRENALSSLRACLDAGITAIEIDLQRSADGTLWLLHDDRLDRVTDGVGTIADADDVTLAGLHLRGPDGQCGEEGLARFDAVLDLAAAHPESLLMLDLKSTPPAPVVAALNARGLGGNALLLTFSWEKAEDAFGLSSDVRVSVLVKDDADLERALALATPQRLAIYLGQDASPSLFAKAGATGALVVTDAVMPVAGGSLDSRAEKNGGGVYRHFCAERPSGLIVTDRPLRLRDALRPQPLVSLRNLRIAFSGTQVVHGVDLDIGRGETLGIVGESGCGKSVSWLAVLGLLPESAAISGTILLDGEDITNAGARRLEDIRGKRIAMIFQDPSSSLNPVMRVGEQIAEAVRLHRGLSPHAAREEALNLMQMVGIPDRHNRYGLYPHEFSGGQAQRLMIAIALAGQPELLVADEPTTALDATIQAQILELLNRLRAETGMALVFISHDLGAVSQVCSTISVMYAGRVVETRPSEAILEAPRHPYTLGLFRSIPSLRDPPGDLPTVSGAVPDPAHLPQGCAFAPRCQNAVARCAEAVPSLELDGDGAVACWAPVVPEGAR